MTPTDRVRALRAALVATWRFSPAAASTALDLAAHLQTGRAAPGSIRAAALKLQGAAQ